MTFTTPFCLLSGIAIHDENSIPFLTWQDLPRRERIVLLAVMIALLTLGIGFYVWIASVPSR